MNRKKSTLRVIKELTETVTSTNDVDLGDMVILIKIKSKYLRFSTKTSRFY